ncbi:MAG TPA: hypothetical protein ACFYED_10990 [Candidatus Tripitaka californicus]|uniref:hypothetical protein n=1 Tax=Candidatus Tripitaka californicus TaxID=3367616 RepID=UPI004025144B
MEIFTETSEKPQRHHSEPPEVEKNLTQSVTLSGAKGLVVRFFASLRMTRTVNLIFSEVSFL